MKNYTLLLFITLFAASCQQVAAQTLTAVYNTGNSPLPDNEVRCIATDANGTTWIGTTNGLAAYNGAEWVVYTTGNSPLPENNIRSLGIDAANRIWIGTFSSGLAMFDGNEWQTYNSSNSGLPDNYVKSIAFDNDGQKLWLGLSGGLAMYDGINWLFYNAIGSDVLLNNVNDVVFDPEHHIWVCTVNGGLVTFTKNQQLFAYKVSNSGVPDNTLLAIAADAQNTKWMTTVVDGLGRFDGMNWQTYQTINSGIASNNTTDVCANLYNNDIWIGTANAGISIFTPAANLWTTLNTDNAGLPDNHITAFCINSNGTIWAGTKTGGLLQFYQDFTANSFTPHLQNSENKLFPNPCNGQICLPLTIPTTPTTTLTVYAAANGKTVLQQQFTQPCIHTVNLLSGCYFAALWQNKQLIFCQKFYVIH